MQALFDIGMVGLSVMGRSLALNMADHGFRVAGYNRSREVTEQVMREHPHENLSPFYSLQELVAALRRPRRVMLMIQAGSPVDAVIGQLEPLLEEGDILLDGGNSFFEDTRRRQAALEKKGIVYFGVGVSGGEEGARHGPSIMPGGDEQAYPLVRPVLEAVAARAAGEPCCAYIGPDGAGHYVKMVHNGIEYSDMQLIAESYDLMRRGLGMTPAEIGDVFEEWNKTELDSYLIEITAEVLHQVDKKTGKPLVDLIVDHAGMKGTGTWTVQTALSLAVPVTGIAEAVFARGLSSEADLRDEAQKQGFAGPDGKLNLNDDEKKAFIEDIRQALYASKIVAYAQGFNEITTAAKEYGWDIDLAAVARIWRGGCIIRAKFLNRISEAFESGEANVSLLFAPYFKNAIENAEKSWRNVVAQAAINGLPTPAFASSLSYFDGLRSKRLPAALIQGQRDYFGAHTYQRVDQPGAFHTLWAEPGREEIEA